MSDELTPGSEAELGEILGLIVAALAAVHRDDWEGAAAVLAGSDWEAVAGHALGIISTLGPVAAGSPERWLAMLTAWQPGTRLGDNLSDY